MGIVVIQLVTEYHIGGVLGKIYRVLPSGFQKLTYMSTDVFLLWFL